MQKIRERKGATIMVINSSGSGQIRLCDLASSHTMRITAITTMLSLGVPEQIVRKISGHAPASKEFYRYVTWSQTYQDREIGRGFEWNNRKFFGQ